MNHLSARKIIIAIDGHASSGKSTLAKRLAEALQYTYVDTGAMYRAVALFFLQNSIDWTDSYDVKNAMENIEIHFVVEAGDSQIYLNGDNVNEAIRSMEILEIVSDVAKIPYVRQVVVAQQQAMGNEKGIVMDGRDIGTVVFPDAELKIFLTADGRERARRRALEMEENGVPVRFSDVYENIQQRDFIDSTRSESPLKLADDAICIDSTNLNRDALFEKVFRLAEQIISA